MALTASCCWMTSYAKVIRGSSVAARYVGSAGKDRLPPYTRPSTGCARAQAGQAERAGHQGCAGRPGGRRAGGAGRRARRGRRRWCGGRSGSARSRPDHGRRRRRVHGDRPDPDQEAADDQGEQHQHDQSGEHRPDQYATGAARRVRAVGRAGGAARVVGGLRRPPAAVPVAEPAAGAARVRVPAGQVGHGRLAVASQGAHGFEPSRSGGPPTSGRGGRAGCRPRRSRRAPRRRRPATRCC